MFGMSGILPHRCITGIVAREAEVDAAIRDIFSVA